MNKNFNLSVFRNGKAGEKEWELTIKQLSNRIANSKKLEEETEEIRKIHAQGKLAKVKLVELLKKEGYDLEKIAAQENLKRLENLCKDKKVLLPMITVHAYFENGRKDKDPHTFNNLILTDIDHISEEQINELMPKIKALPYVIFACRSVRGEGIHILSYVEVKEGINDDNFKDVFEVTTQAVEYDLNIEADRNVCSISRCMFLNYDEQVYYNPEVIPLDVNTALWIKKDNINNNKVKEMTQRDGLSAYLDAAKANLNWRDGNRHSTIVSLASSLNRAGFDVEDVVAECTSRYAQSDFTIDEIENTIRDVYNRYVSDHGKNQKSSDFNKDKWTKGHLDTLPVNEEDYDDDTFLKSEYPDVEAVRKYIPSYFYDYIINPRKNKAVQFTTLISMLVSSGAVMKGVESIMDEEEEVRTCIFYIVSGAAATGKSCIKKGYEFFRIHAEEIENKSEEEVKIKTREHTAWKKCDKNCKEADCGCGVEPIVPKQVKIDLSLNISASRLTHQLRANAPIPSLLFTSEIDSNLETKDNTLSPILRAGSENEKISSHTHTHGDASLRNPVLALLLAGTPAQLVNFMKNKENGLTSRFLINFLPQAPYEKLRGSNRDLKALKEKKAAFEERAKTFCKYAMNTELFLKLTDNSGDMLDDYFEEALKRYATYSSDPLKSFILRLRKNDVKLAMILTVLGLYDKNRPSGTYDIPDEIIELVISWNDFWIEQHLEFLSYLPEIKKNTESSETKYAELYKKLPCCFTLSEAHKILPPPHDIQERTLSRVLKRWREEGLLYSVHQRYHRVDCQGSTMPS